MNNEALKDLKQLEEILDRFGNNQDPTSKSIYNSKYAILRDVAREMMDDCEDDEHLRKGKRRLWRRIDEDFTPSQDQIQYPLPPPQPHEWDHQDYLRLTEESNLRLLRNLTNPEEKQRDEGSS